MTLSDDLRAELAAIAPKRGCCRLAELSALFHSAGSVHLRGRGEVALHLDVSTSAVARRAFSLLRELGIHSEIRTYSRRSFDRATRYQLHVDGDERALGHVRRGRRPRCPARAGRAAAEARRRPCLLPGRVPARRPARRRFALGAAPAASRAADDVARGRRVPAARRGGRRHPPRRARPRPARGRVREGARRDRSGAHRGGRGRHGARVRGALGRRGRARRGEPARERRSREPRADEPRRAGAARGGARRSRRRGGSSAFPSGCTRSRASGFATRRSRCASSPSGASRRARRPPSTAACGSSRSSRTPEAARQLPADENVSHL